MVSKPHHKFIKWVRQKRRHLKTGNEYKFCHRLGWDFHGQLPLFVLLFTGAILQNPFSYIIWGFLAAVFLLCGLSIPSSAIN
jgi:glucose-6-phosphate-specific signal transduction histidine kinase